MSVTKDIRIEKSLRCPICGSEMKINDSGSGMLYCIGAKRHCYDFSGSGYVNLASSGKSNAGDSKQAVKARNMFLETGLYLPIAKKIVELLNKYASNSALIIDAGCGEGYYSNIIAQHGFLVEGYDLSKFAVDVAAKRAKRARPENTFFAVSSVYSLPVEDFSADAVVNIFAPCVEEEYSRVISDYGTLVVVYAGPNHLLGLKNAVYEHTHVNEERADMPKNMEEVERSRLEYRITVDGNEAIQNLFAMTPYYWKTSKQDFEKLTHIETLTTEVDILFSVYKKYEQ